MSNIENLVQDVTVGRCVGIQITNNTRDVTLEYPRTYCFSGWAMIDPVPLIRPGSSECFLFVKTRYTARGSVGVLSYESDAFTLAILFSNPFDRLLYDIEFALELFTGRKHFHSMDRLYRYMYSHDPPYIHESFLKMRLTDAKDGELTVTNQEIQVTATMSNQKKSIIKVQIEQRDHSPGYTVHTVDLEDTEN
ncbi:uncharacterized protein ACDP82_020296 [Pangshura tecta]